jgi:hypothetical protein
MGKTPSTFMTTKFFECSFHTTSLHKIGINFANSIEKV